jgi:serine/threonine-protein kinase
MAAIEKTLWQAVSPLLDELLDADEARRTERIEQIRSTDQTLAEELVNLLRRQSAVETRQFLEGTALDPVGGVTLAGRTIGNYTLERALGAGGMGSVWLGRRSDGRFEGRAAIKFLNLALLAHGGAERFQREGHLLARLTHPHIAGLLDAGVVSGQPYLLLEYVDGKPIDQWCDENGLDIRARVRLFLDVAAAVAHAHTNLILHCDLKPSNILVRHDGQVKLLDFGIAKLLAEGAHETGSSELTQLAGRAFTPEYAAPEQVQGTDATVASDVYALGVLLYGLLTGRHPTSDAQEPVHARMRAVLEKEPVPLAEAVRSLAPAAAVARGSTSLRLARELRGDLENIVAKALKKDAAERYATVAAFADDLSRYLHDDPVSARRDSVTYRFGKFVRRNRLAVGAVCTTVLVLFVGVIGTTWQAIEARRERDEALFQAESAHARGNLVNLILGTLGDVNRPITQREILDRSVQLVETQFSRKPKIAVGLLLPIAGQYFTLGDTEKDFAVMHRAAEIAAGTGDPGLISVVACGMVNTEIRRGNLDQAKQQLKTGLQALRQVERPRLGVIVECLRAEADVAVEDGDLDRALDRLSQAMARVERDGSIGGNLYPAILSRLALLQEDRGDLAAAFALTKRDEQRSEGLGLTDSVDYLGARANEAGLLMKWGEYRAAQAIIEDVEARWRRDSGAEPPPHRVEAKAGLMLLRLGDAEAARAKLASAAAYARAHGYVGAALAADFALAEALVDLGRFDEASRMLMAVEAAPPPEQSRYTRVTLATVLASLLLAQGKAEQAREQIEHELERIGPATMRNSVPRATALRVAARIHAATGDPARALQAAREAVAASEQVARDPAHSADVGEALLLLAQAQQRSGERALCVSTAQRAASSLASGLGENHRLTRAARALSAG